MTGRIDEVSAETGELRLVDPVELVPNELNPRREPSVSDEFVASIRAAGVLQPLSVFERDRVGEFGTELVVLRGHRRRLGAIEAKAAGSVKARLVPVWVRPEPPAADQIIEAVIENEHREPLLPMDEARSIVRLVESEGLSQKVVAERLGRSTGHVSKRVAIVTRLPVPALAHFEAGRLTVEAAYQLSRVDDPEFIGRFAGGKKVADEATILRAVKAELLRRDLLRAERATVEQLCADDVHVVERHRVVGGSAVVLCGSGDDNQNVRLEARGTDAVWIALTVKDHAGADCHAATVSYEGDVVWVCVAPEAHAEAATLRRYNVSSSTPADIDDIVARNAERAAPAAVVDDGRPSWVEARDRAVVRRNHVRVFSPSAAGTALVEAYAVASLLGEVDAPYVDWLGRVLVSLVDVPDDDVDPFDVVRELPSPRAALLLTAAAVEYALFPDPTGPDDAERSVWGFDTVPLPIAQAYVNWLRFGGCVVGEVEQFWFDACEAADTDEGGGE